jgi:predicted Fe-S protein YdhL (DUF1289 family)
MTMNAIELLAARADLARAATLNVPSPCVSVCQMDATTGYCEGCLRSLDEIRLWSVYSDQEKKAVWANIVARMAKLDVTSP